MSGVNPLSAWMKASQRKKEPPVILDPLESTWMNDNTRKLVNAQVMRYDLGSFLEQCVERYIELAGSKIVGKIKPVSTPFLDESKPEFDENEIIHKIKSARLTATEAGLNQVAANSQGGGMLANIASAVLMEILYAA